MYVSDEVIPFPEERVVSPQVFSAPIVFHAETSAGAAKERGLFHLSNSAKDIVVVAPTEAPGIFDVLAEEIAVEAAAFVSSTTAERSPTTTPAASKTTTPLPPPPPGPPPPPPTTTAAFVTFPAEGANSSSTASRSHAGTSSRAKKNHSFGSHKSSKKTDIKLSMETGAAKTSTTATSTVVDNTTTATTTTAAVCDGCCPQDKQKPTVVIPVYERDLCKMKVTANSIVKHDPKRLLGKILICWVSAHGSWEYGQDLDEIKNLLYGHGEVEVVEINTGGALGWQVQQAAKLKVASLVQTDYYVVMDSKNAILKDVEEDTFFTACNQGKIFGRYDIWDLPGEHKDWYYASAGILGTTVMDWGKWPASVTPIVMHTRTVLDLLDRLGEPHDFGNCVGGLCSAFGNGGTEFTLYLMYVGRVAKFDCIHAIEERPWGKEISASIWRTVDFDGKKGMAEQLKAIAEHSDENGHPLMFGAQAGALDGFDGDWRYDVLNHLSQIYGDAGLNWFNSWDDLASCVVGSFDR
jgi:hypothetical protein